MNDIGFSFSFSFFFVFVFGKRRCASGLACHNCSNIEEGVRFLCRKLSVGGVEPKLTEEWKKSRIRDTAAHSRKYDAMHENQMNCRIKFYYPFSD